MEAVNCPRCGRVFTRIRTPICPACVKEDDETFELVREYVKENPDQSIAQVSEETHVHMKRIMQYVRDGRLEVSTGMSGDVGCVQCGRPILTGRYCESCSKDIKTTFLTRPGYDTKISGKMHAVKRK